MGFLKYLVSDVLTTVRGILSSPTFWSIAIPAGVALWTFSNAEVHKLRWEQYKRKEERYSRLVLALRGFYVDTIDAELRRQFIDELNLCWLYCPDDVIQLGYRFLGTVQTGASTDKSTKEQALGQFVVAIRRDLLSRKELRSTALEGKDFKHLKVSNPERAQVTPSN